MNNMINDKKFYEIMNRIQSKRIELKLSYQDLANKTGLSKSTLQRYETGSIRNIPLDKLEILANALEVSPMWIIGYDTSIKKDASYDIALNAKTTLLLNSFNKLNDEGKNEAIKRVEELTELSKYKKEDNKVAELPKKEKEVLKKEHSIPIAAHAKPGATIEDIKHDDDIMDDDNFWNE